MEITQNVTMEEKKLNICSMDQAERLISAFSGADSEEKEKALYQIVDSILQREESQPSIGGDADAFHNFTVSLVSIAQDYETAVEILQLGLTIHPTNTDLLADAIRYGYNCGKTEECKQWLAALRQISIASWTWRAFSFSIDYLLDVNGSDITSDAADERLKELLNLVKQYQAYYPDREDSYFREYDIFNRTNQKDKAVKVLETAIETFKYCPKCWLRYADIMVDKGDYRAAIPSIKKLCNHPNSADSVNMGYVYSLRGICQIALLSQETEDEDDLFSDPTYDEKKVNSIYDSFRLALAQEDLRENTRTKVKEQLNSLREKTGFEYPERLRALLECES